MKDSLDKMMEKTDKFLMIYAHDSEDERFETEYSYHLYNSKWLQNMKTKEDFQLIYKQEKPEPNCSAVPTYSGGSKINARGIFTVSSGLTAGQGSAGRSNAAGAYLGFSAEL